MGTNEQSCRYHHIDRQIFLPQSSSFPSLFFQLMLRRMILSMNSNYPNHSMYNLLCMYLPINGYKIYNIFYNCIMLFLQYQYTIIHLGNSVCLSNSYLHFLGLHIPGLHIGLILSNFYFWFVFLCRMYYYS